MSTLTVTRTLGTRASSAWKEALQDLRNGAALVGGSIFSTIGFVSVAGGLALLLSADVRESAESVLVSLVEPVAAPADAGTAAQADANPGSSGAWASFRVTGRLEPQQENVVRYLARRYRVAEAAVRQIVGAAFGTGRAIGVDPMLILAVTAIESSLNPFAQSAVGAQGLMQVMTQLHSERFVSHGGDHAALDPIANLKVGSEILKDLIQRGGSVERGLQLYVGAGNLPDDGGYAARVLGEMGRIKLAAAGRVQAALSAGLRSDNRAEAKPQGELLPVSATTGAGRSRSSPAA